MKHAYTWLPGSRVSESGDGPDIVEPTTPQDGLDFEAEPDVWAGLWADRLERGTSDPLSGSVFHSSSSECKGTCPNGVH